MEQSLLLLFLGENEANLFGFFLQIEIDLTFLSVSPVQPNPYNPRVAPARLTLLS